VASSGPVPELLTGALLTAALNTERPLRNAVAGGLPRFKCFRNSTSDRQKLLRSGLLLRSLPARGHGFLAPSFKKGHLWLTFGRRARLRERVVWASVLPKVQFQSLKDRPMAFTVGRQAQFWSSRASLCGPVLDNPAPVSAAVLLRFERVAASCWSQRTGSMLGVKRPLPPNPRDRSASTSVSKGSAHRRHAVERLRTERLAWRPKIYLLPIPFKAPSKAGDFARCAGRLASEPNLGMKPCARPGEGAAGRIWPFF